MRLYRAQGIVLRTYRLGEADRIVVLATAQHGKVRAVAKGVRKTGSRFGARLEPTTHVALQLYEGRDLDTVTQAEAIDHFRGLRADLDRLAEAHQLLEAVDHVLQEREPDPPLHRMLLGALRTLDARPSPLVVPAFFWKLLAHEGSSPMLDACAGCGAEGPLVAFDLVEGGALCRACRRGVPVTPEALELVQRILGGGLNEALSIGAGPLAAEVRDLATRSLEHHLERRLRSAHVLDRH